MNKKLSLLKHALNVKTQNRREMTNLYKKKLDEIKILLYKARSFVSMCLL